MNDPIPKAFSFSMSVHSFTVELSNWKIESDSATVIWLLQLNSLKPSDAYMRQ